MAFDWGGGFRQNCLRILRGPKKEGAARQEHTIADLWRGEPTRRELLLLDNDFFGQPAWRDRISELRDGRFRVCFNQGINCRTLTDEQAEALASVNYRDDSMKTKRLYTAWDTPRMASASSQASADSCAMGSGQIRS